MIISFGYLKKTYFCNRNVLPIIMMLGSLKAQFLNDLLRSVF